MPISLERVVRSTSCLILGVYTVILMKTKTTGFLSSTTCQILFQFGQIRVSFSVVVFVNNTAVAAWATGIPRTRCSQTDDNCHDVLQVIDSRVTKVVDLSWTVDRSFWSSAVLSLLTSDLVVTVTKTITKSNCASFTQTITKTESKSNTKTILKLNQITEYYIKTVTITMLKLKRFSMVNQ